VVDRCEEEGSVRVRHLVEGGWLVAGDEVLDSRDDALKCIRIGHRVKATRDVMRPGNPAKSRANRSIPICPIILSW
jgi:hypothetical protein